MGSSRSDTSSRSGIAYQPALDGVRALAVTLVLLFHHGVAWMTGGYVGVSVFFTLSGFLITSLLLAEHGATGRVSFARFYTRRVKRLLPASLACLTAVAVLGAAGAFQASSKLRREIVAAVLQVANWNDLLQGASYADLQGRRSPVAHFWSLAVEEQFYWVWPLVVALLCKVARRRRDRAAALMALAAVGLAAAPIIAAVYGPDVAYLSTPSRLGEILTGAALAGVLSVVRLRRPWLHWLAPAAVALIVAAAVVWPSGSGPAYRGGLGVLSLASVALILGLQVAGPTVAVFSWRPLVGLGRISYGVYLYHWPVYVLLDEARTELSAWPLLAVRLVVTLTVALASYRLLQQPVRRATLRGGRIAPVMVAAMAAVVALAAVGVSTSEPTYGADAEDLTRVSFAPTTAPLPSLAPATSVSLPPDSSPHTTVLPTGPTTTGPLPVPNRPVRVLVLGDSTAMALSVGLVDFATAHPELAEVEVLARVGCGVVRASVVYGDDGTLHEDCDRALGEFLPQALAQRTPDVVVVLVTLADASPRRWLEAEGDVAPEDERYQERMAADYEALRATLLENPFVHVQWLTAPIPTTWYAGYIGNPITRDSFAPLNTQVESMGEGTSGRVEVADFGAWLEALDAGEDTTWRPDGLHLDPAAARQVVDEFLWPRLVRQVLE